jgi:hypothetical protein
MSKSLRKIMLTAPLAVGLLITSCGGGGNEEDHSSHDTLPKKDSLTENSSLNQEMIGIPSPSDMLGFIRMTTKGGNKNTSFLNPIDNLKKYQDSKSMSLNFGIYSCDLSYCSIFDMGSQAQDYFRTVKTLGEEIGVSSVMTPEVMKRAEANVKNPDSLVMIADEIYYSSSDILERNGKGPTLALVIAGGYIESLNIAANVIKFDPKNPAVSRFADQKYILEDVILFLKKYESDEGVTAAREQFEQLKAEFDKLKETPVEPPKNTDKKKKVFGGGTVLEITQEQFKAIAEKVKNIRNNFAQIK